MADDVLRYFKDIFKWDPPSWYSMGVCYRLPHSVKLLYSNKRKERAAAADLFCSNCIVQYACLERAIKEEEAGGVWGGFHEDERLEIDAYWIVKTRESLPLAVRTWKRDKERECNGGGEGSKARTL